MNLINVSDLKRREILHLIRDAQYIKHRPSSYRRKLFQKSLLMLFQAPSLRTRVSFETAMIQMGGSAINYSSAESPWGAGKESIEDVARVLSRYNDAITARIYDHDDLRSLAEHASVPVINAMTNSGHPCQILSDLFTIAEKKKEVKGLKVAYLGDAENNVTYSLMEAAAIMGFDLRIGCPDKKKYMPQRSVLQAARALAGSSTIEVFHNPKKAAYHADVVYTDSWMSYRIPASEKKRRSNDLKGFQVNDAIMKVAQRNAMFMHCLPALRGNEVTASVIDGPNSYVFTQAENRMHMQKAILLKLLT